MGHYRAMVSPHLVAVVGKGCVSSRELHVAGYSVLPVRTEEKFQDANATECVV
jgi:hypothetical protein